MYYIVTIHDSCIKDVNANKSTLWHDQQNVLNDHQYRSQKQPNESSLVGIKNNV